MVLLHATDCEALLALAACLTDKRPLLNEHLDTAYLYGNGLSSVVGKLAQPAEGDLPAPNAASHSQSRQHKLSIVLLPPRVSDCCLSQCHCLLQYVLLFHIIRVLTSTSCFVYIGSTLAWVCFFVGNLLKVASPFSGEVCW